MEQAVDEEGNMEEHAVSKGAIARLHRSLFRHPDRLSGTVLSLVAVFALIESAPLPFGSIRAPDAGFFPKSLSSLLLIFSLGIVLNSFFGKSESVQFFSRSWQVAAASAAFVVYALVLPKIGFVMATVALLLLVMRGLGGMSWIQSILIAILSVLLSYLAFVQLGVPLPRGPMPF